MLSDLFDLFSGWYSSFLDSVLLKSSTEVVVDGSDNVVSSTASSLSAWSAYVPWEHIMAFVFLVVFTVCLFKLLRTILCKIL